METCGSWTKKCRKESGKSQEETAEFLNVALRTYQYYESGERTFLEHELERLEILFNRKDFSLRYMQLKNPFWEKKLKEAAAAVVALKEIQEQISLLTPQILGMADFIQSVC